MKFQPDALPGTNVISRQQADRVWVGNQSFDHSLLVPWRGEVQPWRPRTFEQLEQADFEVLLGLTPELVILGTGPRMAFAHPSMLQALIGRRIGVEAMDTAAACRTYNVLASEGRAVVAALLVPVGASPSAAL